ncbi:protein kinase subdomain-containing protein PKL/ccin4 [Coprinopsis cinerea AmutBmut pab1-1]|nr:protein kinase subdomain-containing protein PKL/ccin4 [Coprinopsis cinerea AmutBmut pab1-1]
MLRPAVRSQENKESMAGRSGMAKFEPKRHDIHEIVPHGLRGGDWLTRLADIMVWGMKEIEEAAEVEEDIDEDSVAGDYQDVDGEDEDEDEEEEGEKRKKRKKVDPEEKKRSRKKQKSSQTLGGRKSSKGMPAPAVFKVNELGKGLSTAFLETPIPDCARAWMVHTEMALMHSAVYTWAEEDWTSGFIHPLAGGLLSVLEALSGGDLKRKRWLIKAETRDTNNRKFGDIGVVDDDLKCIIAMLELKGPRTSGTPSVDGLVARPLLPLYNMQRVLVQLVRQGRVGIKLRRDTKKFEAADRGLVHGLAIPPAHLFAAYSKPKNRTAIGGDWMTYTGRHPEATRSFENWRNFLESLTLWLLIALWEEDEKIKTVTKEKWREEKEFVEDWFKDAGEALELGTPWKEQVLESLTWALRFIQVAMSVPWIQLAQSFTQTARGVRWLSDGRVMELKVDGRWIPISLYLPAPTAIRRSNGNTVYVYRRWGVKLVVKEFREKEQYEAEVNCYKALSRFQGRGIPVLYATGKVGLRRAIVMSYEGEKMERSLTGDEKVKLQPVLQALHDSDLHHHDLAPRNVVRDSGGKLSLIDFGLAGKCEDSDVCLDEWDDGSSGSGHVEWDDIEEEWDEWH